MLRKGANQPEFVDFYLPFGGRLRRDNRWVHLSRDGYCSEFGGRILFRGWGEKKDGWPAEVSRSGWVTFYRYS